MSDYKIPHTPSIKSSTCELADYLEIMCFLNEDGYSITNAHRQINYISDEIDEGNNDYDDDDRLYDLLQEALSEVDRRNKSCRGRYPFSTSNNSIVNNPDCNEQDRLIYKYLLLATRLNMKKYKIVDNIDGTLIFETLSSLVAKEYFGNKAESIVFGTGVAGGFKEKVNDLTLKMGEGGCYKEPEDGTNDEKDGGLDIVVWKPFSDKRKGKVIGFGQCKTGTTWRDEAGRLCPDDFCSIYFNRQPYVDPIKLFFISEIFRNNYEKLSTKAGVIFDRCRIMDFLPELSKELIDKITIWVNGNQKEIESAYLN